MTTEGFGRWLVQWFEATETAYYCAVDFPHTRSLGGICSCILGGWFRSSRASFCTDLGSGTWTSGPLQRFDR
ncbi:hypothetical protein Taro_012145 [Colocasia esculenta]|uniref:Uncharacterized protein n=1 Tax=Colocasia esculenta TaxID=4460 RepID=A0A843UC58_COLES|nr:hypothetical protein [Colocasia esculenta]